MYRCHFSNGNCYSSYNNFEKDVLNLSCFPQKLANKIYSDFPGYPNLIHHECFQLNVANTFGISLDYDDIRVSLLYVLNVDFWYCRIILDIFHYKIIYYSTIDILLINHIVFIICFTYVLAYLVHICLLFPVV